MDDRLKRALEFSNYRLTLYQQLDNLKLKTQNGLMFSHNGGTFKINRELIAFCNALLEDDQTETILLDINELPVFVSNLKEFYDTIYSKYFEVLNDYHQEYEKSRKSRRPAAIVEMEENEE